MTFTKFKQHFKDHQLIKVQEIKNAFPDYNRVQVSRWAKKGRLVRVRRGQYVIASRLEEIDKELLANEIKNSYISLEYALHKHNLIPEIPQKITSVTTERTGTIETPVGGFIYRRISPKLYTGYQLVDSRIENRKVHVGTPTKSLFDFIYLHNFSTFEEFEELRLNFETLSDVFDRDNYLSWTELVDHPGIKNRLIEFHSFVEKHAELGTN